MLAYIGLFYLPITVIRLESTAVLKDGASPITSHLYRPEVSSVILFKTTVSAEEFST